jgi:hypothetical protein
MMPPSSPRAQFDLGTVRSPVDNDEPLIPRLIVAAAVGLAVGTAFLLVIPDVPGLVRAVWCVGDTAATCDPINQTTGRLVNAVIWAVVLAGTATLVGAPLGWLAALGRVRVVLPSVLLGPPVVWAVGVLGEPFGVPLNRLRSPWILAQTAVAYLLVGWLTARRPRPLWRWLAAGVLVAGTAVVLAIGYPYD